MPERDYVSWNTMIGGYVKNGRMEDALRLLTSMPENVLSSMKILSSSKSEKLIAHLIRTNRLSKARDVFHKNGAEGCFYMEFNDQWVCETERNSHGMGAV
ncbi:hypothetical protein LWI29_023354 [Acer saccharum]|uniref:Pentatricopeptide repeat-containing protein n=1 Tax=Acer saccharum TaxID=4024 RepID=A0AA39RZZ0_ACESA|nr:hypothetical protein LWI29_023354 [Acer saccharum]